MNKNLMIVALVMAFAQVGFSAPGAVKSTVVQAKEARLAIDRKALEEVANKGKSAKERRSLVIEAYGADASVKAAAEIIGMDKTDLLSHLATNPAAIDTVNYTTQVLSSEKAMMSSKKDISLNVRAARANAKILRNIARNAALTAKDQADIPAVRKAVAVGAVVAQYGESAVRFIEVWAEKTEAQGSLTASVALRQSGKEVLKLNSSELEKFMDSKNEESFANCKL